MIIHIPLETPSKKNSRVVDRRTGRTFPNKRFTEWHKAAALYVRQQHAHPLDEGPFALYLEFTHGDKIRRYSDNESTSSELQSRVWLHGCMQFGCPATSIRKASQLWEACNILYGPVYATDQVLPSFT